MLFGCEFSMENSPESSMKWNFDVIIINIVRAADCIDWWIILLKLSSFWWVCSFEAKLQSACLTQNQLNLSIWLKSLVKDMQIYHKKFHNE